MEPPSLPRTRIAYAYTLVFDTYIMFCYRSCLVRFSLVFIFVGFSVIFESMFDREMIRLFLIFPVVCAEQILIEYRCAGSSV